MDQTHNINPSSQESSDKATDSATSDVVEEASSVEIEIPFIYDESATSQLGGKSYVNETEAQLFSPRSTITARELRHFRFQARYRGGARFGTFDQKPACLIILDFSFQKFGSTPCRYKHAEIDVAFEDGKAALADVQDPQEFEDCMAHQPRILAFEPHEYHGPGTSGTGSTTIGGSVSLSAPGGILGASLNPSRTTPFAREGYAKVHGFPTDEDSRIVFSVDENSMSGDGIRSEWSAAMVVQYTPGRRFAARVHIKAHIFLRVTNPVCGAKDDPVFFDLEYMRGAGKVNTAGSDQQGSTTVPSVQGQALDGVDLKAETRLGAWGGTFLDVGRH